MVLDPEKLPLLVLEVVEPEELATISLVARGLRFLSSSSLNLRSIARDSPYAARLALRGVRPSPMLTPNALLPELSNSFCRSKCAVEFAGQGLLPERATILSEYRCPVELSVVSGTEYPQAMSLTLASRFGKASREYWVGESILQEWEGSKRRPLECLSMH